MALSKQKQKEADDQAYGLWVGCRISMSGFPDSYGVLLSIDRTKAPPTTCTVAWDPDSNQTEKTISSDRIYQITFTPKEYEDAVAYLDASGWKRGHYGGYSDPVPSKSARSKLAFTMNEALTVQRKRDRKK